MALISYSPTPLMELPNEIKDPILLHPFKEADRGYLGTLNLVSKYYYQLSEKTLASHFNTKKWSFKKFFNFKSPKKQKEYLLNYIKSVPNALKHIDISFLKNCTNGDIEKILSNQKNLESFSFNRDCITNAILPQLVGLKHIKIKLNEFDAEDGNEILENEQMLEDETLPASENDYDFSDNPITLQKTYKEQSSDLKLCIGNPEIIELIKQNPDLETFFIDNDSDLSGYKKIHKNVLESLSQLKNLKHLMFNNWFTWKAEDIETLAHSHPNLESLSVAISTEEALAALAHLPKLRKLVLTTCLKNFSHLENIANLEILKVIHPLRSVDFSFIDNLKMLKKFSLLNEYLRYPEDFILNLKQRFSHLSSFEIL